MIKLMREFEKNIADVIARSLRDVLANVMPSNQQVVRPSKVITVPPPVKTPRTRGPFRTGHGPTYTKLPNGNLRFARDYLPKEIVRALSEGSMTSTEIAQKTCAPGGTVRGHLKRLQTAGTITRSDLKPNGWQLTMLHAGSV